MTKSFTQKMAESQMHLLQMYTDDKDTRPWAVAWSGGKDSTAVMGILVNALESLPKEKRTRKVYVVMSDTKAENPELEIYMHDQVNRLNTYSKNKELPIEASIVSRPVENSYFVLTLGRGYFLPLNNGQGRWCTDRLKIQPSNDKLREIDPSFILIGTRMSESMKRRVSIEKWTENSEVDEKIGRHSSLTNSRTFMVIVDFTIDDVWRYLSMDRLGWSSTAEVRRLYKEATGECGINNPKGVEEKAKEMEGCGARFGCWMCPVILTDKSTEEMSKTHNWMEPLSEWRSLQMKVYGGFVPDKIDGQRRKDRSEVLRKWEAINEKINVITKSGYNRKGTKMKDGQGTFTLEARKYLFEKLIETQELVNRIRELDNLPPLSLVSEEEIDRIKELWKEDEREYPHLITNDAGIPFNNIFDLLDGIISEEDVESYKTRRKERLDARKRKKEEAHK